MNSYEVEIKSLLGDADAAGGVRRRMRELDPDAALLDSYKQLNHYFAGGDVKKLAVEAEPYVSDEGNKVLLNKIATQGKKHSVRTREHNNERLLVIKSSIDDTTSDNGIIRLEFEAPMPLPTFQALDDLVRSADFDYQAKWSREREIHSFRDIQIFIDKNAGYGYLAEFEKVVPTPEAAKSAREELIQLMEEFGVEELSQERLGRMFNYYNENWADYYGTDKTFTIY